MPGPQNDDDVEPRKERALHARQWSRTALALAAVFASLPVAGKLFLGSWKFDGALDLAGLCLFTGAYFYFVARDHQPQTPDPALVLGKALQLAVGGAVRDALALLDEALQLDPNLWQAWEYRGRIHLAAPGGAESALEDFSQAIRLAPNEPHLYYFRGHAFALLGQESSARADWETAARLERASIAKADPN